MPTLNRVMLMGNLTRDPELKTIAGGTQIAEFGLAINEEYTNKQGQPVKSVVFLDIKCWAGTAEAAGKYLKKGSAVYIEGKIKVDSWEDKNTGAKRTKVFVNAERFQFLDSKRGNGNGGENQAHAGRQSAPASRAAAVPAVPPPPPPSVNDDEIPF